MASTGDRAATASGEAPDGNRVSDDDDATIPTKPAPSILLTKSVSDASGDGTASVGEVLTYTFTVKNTGDVPLNDLQLSDSRLWPGTQACTDSSVSMPHAGPAIARATAARPSHRLMLASSASYRSS